MKKIILVFVLSLIMFIPKTNAIVTSSSSLDDVKIYLFCEESSKCDSAKEWVKNIESEYIRVGFKYIDVKKEKDITSSVKKSLKIRKNSLPLFVIGTNYFLGFNDNIKDEIRNAISAYEKEEEFCDIVYKIQNKENTKDCIEQNKNIYEVKKNKVNVITILIIVSSLIIIVIAILFINKKYLKRTL